MAKKLTLLTAFWCFTFLAFAQYANPCKKSTEGTDFWFGFMESRNYNTNHYIEITVTARESTTFTITIGKDLTPFEGTFNVAANSSRQVRIPWEMVEAIGSENIEEKGIHLVSEKPVNLYALNYDQNSADVAVIYPVESLGKEYFAMCYDVDIHTNNSGGYGNGRNSQFLVVATEDSTAVLIIPSKETDQLVAAGDSILIELNKGEVFQVQSENDYNLPNQGDLTQSFIQSDKPIALYSGSLATAVPTGDCCWDHLYEQIPPIQSWGREYYAVPLRTRESDRYRIMAAKDNTTVHISGESSFTLNKSEFKEIILYHDEPSRIYSEQPILVAQFSQSRDVDFTYTGGNGDPFMIVLSSTSQSKNDVTFVTYKSDNISGYYVNIISLTSEVDNIRFDDTPIPADFTPFPNSEYSYAQKAISGGTYRIHNINQDRGFLAYVYGYGGVESYGYGVGFNLDLVLDLGESINFNGDTLLLCDGETRVLDAGPYFDTYAWDSGDTTQTLEVTTSGKYKVRTTTIDGCELEDSIYVFVSSPEIELGVEHDEGCFPYSIDLNGKDGFEKYLWQNQNDDTLSTNQLYTARETDEYRLTVFDKYNCPARDTMNLVVFPVPKVEISGKEHLCGAKQTELTLSITDAPEEVWKYDGSFSWKCNNTDLSFTNAQQTSTSVEVLNWGVYTIWYELTTTDGCLTGDTITIAFHPTPTSAFEFVENPDDKCKGYSREVKYTGNATSNANYFWDYGGASLIDSLSWDNFIVSIGAYNTNPYISLFVEENGCWSDTTASLLGANPDFTLDTEKANGCDSLTVVFKGELKVEDALQFEWNFGDGSPASNQQEVEHFYNSTGFFDVSLLITNTLSGCQIGFKIDSMIKVFPTPEAVIEADELSCHSDSAKLVYINNIDSSICHWSFDGAHQSGTGNDSITVAIDLPIARAQLLVEEFGCISEPAEVLLKRKPHFDFFVDNEEGCQPLATEIYAEPKDEMLEFYWLTDSFPYPQGNSTVYFFPDSGRMDVSLIANSTETGCTDTLTKTNWLWIHPKPKAAFEVDFPVALLEHADISFFNQSELANYFNWDFGDMSLSSEENPIHTYTELGEYNAQLIAESLYGCTDTAELLIKILPFSVFTPNAFRPDSEIAENRTFMPLGVGADESRFNLQIFDRWGQLIFESDSPDHPWDGTNKNGDPAPMGNYIWMSNYFDIQGFEHNQKGQVLLVR
ncbi:PKD domain-containing protein [uncultured Draconibacterium sp.]|uniref:PKD domain-containing protein n=1 Tax=uncultured Draconibacterium sp. TaxID=1573823 RepID=UPI00325FF27C